MNIHDLRAKDGILFRLVACILSNRQWVRGGLCPAQESCNRGSSSEVHAPKMSESNKKVPSRCTRTLIPEHKSLSLTAACPELRDLTSELITSSGFSPIQTAGMRK